jgi:cobalt-zinc-cadmium efflux system membrane fusion protein
MKLNHFLRGVSALSIVALLASPISLAYAGAGHDHGEAQATTTAAPALPSFEAANERFELVGRVQSDELKIWLDDWATNAPVAGAKIELAVAGQKLVPTLGADGTYAVPFPQANKAGSYPLGLTISGVGTPVLLGATLVISEEAAHGHDDEGIPLMWILGGGALALVIVGGGLVLMQRRRTAAFASIGVLAGMSLVGFGVAPQPVAAGGDHDHGTEAAAPGGGSPDQASRLGNGDLNAPKSMQRLIALRTIVGAATNSTQTLTLNGVVIPDPNASGVVQSQIGGRVSGNLPALGASVGRGQAMATITPAFDPGARAALVADQGQVAQDLALARQRTARFAAGSAASEVDAELVGARARAAGGATAEARVRLQAAQARLARLERLTGVVPQRDIVAASADVRAIQAQISASQAEADATVRALQSRRAALVGDAQGEAAALGARQSALSRTSSPSETARAPVSGIVSAVSVSQGQVVAPGETLFTIVNPSRLLVEAQANGPAAAGISGQATARTADGRTMTLLRQGAGLSLVNGSAPIRFIVELSEGLRAGEPVTVFAGSSVPVTGIAIPRQAVTRGANGQSIVYVKKSAERFTPVPVVISDLDGERVLVTSGISAGARIVVAGSGLLAQVR